MTSTEKSLPDGRRSAYRPGGGACPAGARSASSQTAGPSLPSLRLFSVNLWSDRSSPREIGPYQTTVTFTQDAVDFTEGLRSSAQQKESVEPPGAESAAHAGGIGWASAESLGLAGVFSPPARPRLSRFTPLWPCLRRPRDHATKREREVREVCRQHRFRLKSTTVVFARQKVARETRVNPPLSPAWSPSERSGSGL
jgi:hypothetical protein